MVKKIKYLLPWLLRIMVALSGICLLYTLIEGMTMYRFDRNLSFCGFQNFIELLLQYKLIYSGTMFLAVGYAAIVNLAITKDAADHAKMISNREHWWSNVERAIAKLEQRNSFMSQNIWMYRDRIFEFVREIDGRFSNKEQLVDYFDRFLSNGEVTMNEIYHPSYRKYHGYYPSDNICWSFTDYNSIQVCIAEPLPSYSSYFNDAGELYMERVKQMPDHNRKIDPEKYNSFNK